jgi:PAT family beta-lactamase induction signal transducer AmpG
MQGSPSATESAPTRPLYLQRTMLVLLALGYGGGVPLEMAFNIVPTWASATGWSVVNVGALSLAKLPYSFKVLWAPLTDHLGIPGLRWMGRRRAWLLLSQVVCLLLILLLAWNMDAHDHAATPELIMVLLGVLVFAGATQDIVGDAFRAEVLQPRELGAGASVFVTGARIASVVGGAGALIVASRLQANDAWRGWAWGVAIGLLALSTVIGMAGTLLAKEPARAEGMAHGFAASVVQPFQSTLIKSTGKLALAAMAKARLTMKAMFCFSKAMPSSTAITPRHKVVIFDTRSSEALSAMPFLTTVA